MPTLNELTPEQITDLTRQHVEASLSQLRLGYVDLLMLHWPSIFNEGDVSENRKRRIAAWEVLEDVYTNDG